MPSARISAKSRRTGEEVLQMTWAAPTEPQTISFAPNVTPGTFTEPPPLLDIPEESKLFPAVEDDFIPASTKKHTHGKKRAQDHVPRPPNAFILFRSSFIKSQHVSSNIEGNHGTLSKIVGLLWHNLPHEERQSWQMKARRILEEHKKRFPEYSFKPAPKDKDAVATGGGGAGEKKRRVRETGPKDTKRCEVIASLLANGKKGKELEMAIEEYDRQRAPVIETRFEAPLTARQYRRSSSAPAPDTDNSKTHSAFMSPSKPTHKRKRSSSISRLDLPPQPIAKESPLTVDTSIAPSPMSFSAGTPSFWGGSCATPSPSTGTPYAFDTDCNFDFGNFNFSAGCATPHAETCSPLDPAQPYLHQPQPHPLSIQTSFDTWSSNSNSEYSPSPNDSVPTTPETLINCVSTPAIASSYDQYGQYVQCSQSFTTSTYEQQPVLPPVSVSSAPVYDAQTYADMPPLVDPPVQFSTQSYADYSSSYNGPMGGQCVDMSYTVDIQAPNSTYTPSQQQMLGLGLDFSFEFSIDSNRQADHHSNESNLGTKFDGQHQFSPSSCGISSSMSMPVFNSKLSLGGLDFSNVGSNLSDIMAMAAIPSY